MKFHRNNVTAARPLDFDELIDFAGFDFKPVYPLLGLKDCHASGEFRLEEGQLVCSLHVEAKATYSDAYTCRPFEDELRFDDYFALLSNYDEEGEGYVFEENKIDLFDVVFCAIHSHIPLAPKQEGSRFPTSGEGYTVYREEDFLAKPNSSPFDVLEGYDTEGDDPK